MKKILFVVVTLSGLVGVAVGFAVGIFAYPYIFLKDIVAAEALPTGVERKALATGSFIHANRADPIHWGKGSVAVYRDVLHLGGDFEVGPGPKYHVYLVADANVTTQTDVPKTRYVDLGRLRAFKGSQNYGVPAGVNPADFGSVVIWCEQFGVLISPASLKGASK